LFSGQEIHGSEFQKNHPDKLFLPSGLDLLLHVNPSFLAIGLFGCFILWLKMYF